MLNYGPIWRFIYPQKARTMCLGIKLLFLGVYLFNTKSHLMFKACDQIQLYHFWVEICLAVSFTLHSVPERVYKKINSSGCNGYFWRPNYMKIPKSVFRLHPSLLDTPIFWKKHPREKWQKVDPHYFSIFYFLHFFPKIPLSASKLLKSEILPLKLQKGLKVDIF